MSGADLYERAERLYQTRLRADLERTHRNSFVAIEPESGDFFLGRTLSEGSVDGSGRALVRVRLKNPTGAAAGGDATSCPGSRRSAFARYLQWS